MHVKRTCNSTIKGEPYKVKGCLFGHNDANVGKEIYEIRKDQAYKNLLLQHGRYIAAEERKVRHEADLAAAMAASVEELSPADAICDDQSTIVRTISSKKKEQALD